MLRIDEVLRILNHNGASRRYSKTEAKLIHDFLQIIVKDLLKKT